MALRAPKLERPENCKKVFEATFKNRSYFPMHRQRLLKTNLGTHLWFFSEIRSARIARILKEYQDIDIKLDRKRDTITRYFHLLNQKKRFFPGYVFTERELGQKHEGWINDPNFRKMESKDTEIEPVASSSN